MQGEALTVKSYSEADIKAAIAASVSGVQIDTDVDGILDAAADGGAVVVTLTAGSGRTVVTDEVTVWVKTAP